MSEHKGNLLFGAAICTLGYFCVAVMSACSKLAVSKVPVPTVLFFQNLICLALILPWVLKKGLMSLKTRRIGLHLTRDITGLLSFFSLFFALKTIPLADGVLLQNTAPLWIPLVIYGWLRIHIKKYLWWGMLIGFLGVVLILKPGSDALQIGSFLGITSGIFLGISLVSIRRLTSTEPLYRILSIYSLFGVLATAPFAFSGPLFFPPYTWLLLLGVGGFMFLAQILITYSFKHGKASTLAPIAYSAVFFSVILGWLIWNHIPDFLSIIGMILVITGSILSIYFEKKNDAKIEKV